VERFDELVGSEERDSDGEEDEVEDCVVWVDGHWVSIRSRR